jgi:hypothetical protein
LDGSRGDLPQARAEQVSTRQNDRRRARSSAFLPQGEVDPLVHQLHRNLLESKDPDRLSAGRGRLPIDREDLDPKLPIEFVGVLPHGADRRFVWCHGTLDAVVAVTRSIEKLMKSVLDRLHRAAAVKRSGDIDFMLLTGRRDAEAPFESESRLRSGDVDDQTGAREPYEFHSIDPVEKRERSPGGPDPPRRSRHT